MSLGTKTFGILLFASTAWGMTYIVRQGDVLSKIASFGMGTPIYGQQGSLIKLLSFNPQIKNPDLIYPGEKIFFEKALDVINAAFIPVQAPRLPASEIVDGPEIKLGVSELNLRFQLGYGATFMALSQEGTFGGIRGRTIAGNTTSLSTTATYENWKAEFQFTRYSLGLGTDSANMSLKDKKTFQEFTVKAGTKKYQVGLRSKTTPLLQTMGATALQWSDFTTTSALASAHFERELTGHSNRPFILSSNIDAEYIFSGQGASGIQVSNLSGYGARLEGQAQKALTQDLDIRYFMGFKAAAIINHVQFDGNSGGVNGSVRRDLKEVQALLTFEIQL